VFFGLDMLTHIGLHNLRTTGTSDIFFVFSIIISKVVFALGYRIGAYDFPSRFLFEG